MQNELNLFEDPSWRKRLPARPLLKILLFLLCFWLPVLLLAVVDSFFGYGNEWMKLTSDPTFQIRFLWVLPLFYFFPASTDRIVDTIIVHFSEGRLIPEEDKDDYWSIIEETRWLNERSFIKWAILGIAYAIGLYLSFAVHEKLSLSEMWLYFISYPFFYFTMFILLFRMLLWWRLLFKVSKLNLSLTPSHGDRAGGLSFLSLSIRAFTLPVLAISSSVVAGAFKEPAEVITLEYLRVSLGIFCTLFFIIFIGPLFFFFRHMQRAKDRGIISYGSLTMKQIRRLESKWIEKKNDDELLVAPDFSSACDASGLVNNISEMRLLPFQVKELIVFFIAAIFPFAPLFARKVSWTGLFERLLGLVL